MSLAFSITDAEKIITDADLPSTVKNVVNNSQRSLREFSALVGMHENYLSQQINRKNISIPLLYTITMHLKVNMFERLSLMLPTHLQGTKREAALETEISRLNAELADVKKERDIYKEILLKRGANTGG